jgi:hypothetical protein
MMRRQGHGALCPCAQIKPHVVAADDCPGVLLSCNPVQACAPRHVMCGQQYKNGSHAEPTRPRRHGMTTGHWPLLFGRRSLRRAVMINGIAADGEYVAGAGTPNSA